MESNTGAITLPACSQVCSVVRDVDKTVEFLSSTFGIGPWRIFEVSRSEEDVKVGHGAYKAKIAAASLGSIDIELVQPIEGETTFSHYLETRGEGLHHIAFRVPDMSETVTKLNQQGVNTLQSVVGEAIGYAYMEPDKTGGIIFEIVQARS